MPSFLIIGFFSGLVAALMFVSAVSGSVLSLFVYWLAFLPLFIAGFGWRSDCALAGSGIGAFILFLVLGSKVALLFFFLIGLPVTLLTAQTSLSVNSANYQTVYFKNIGSGVDISTPGFMIILSALLATIMACLMYALISFQEQIISKQIEALITDSKFQLPLPKNESLSADEQIAANVKFVLKAIPPVSGLSWMSSLLFNYWLGYQICRVSGRLAQPIHKFQEMRFPIWVLPLFAFALIISGMSGMVGTAGLSLAFALWLAFIILGIIILVSLWRDSQLAGFWTAILFLSLILFGWIANIVPGVVGLTDPIVNFRKIKKDSKD